MINYNFPCNSTGSNYNIRLSYNILKNILTMHNLQICDKQVKRNRQKKWYAIIIPPKTRKMKIVKEYRSEEMRKSR